MTREEFKRLATNAGMYDDEPRDRKRSARAKNATLTRKQQRAAKRARNGG